MTVSALAFFIPVQQGIDCYYSFELVTEQINLMTYRHLLTFSFTPKVSPLFPAANATAAFIDNYFRSVSVTRTARHRPETARQFCSPAAHAHKTTGSSARPPVDKLTGLRRIVADRAESRRLVARADLSPEIASRDVIAWRHPEVVKGEVVIGDISNSEVWYNIDSAHAENKLQQMVKR